jgi:hypothetical protein
MGQRFMRDVILEGQEVYAWDGASERAENEFSMLKEDE